MTRKTAHGEKSKEGVLKGENNLNNESQGLRDLNIWESSQQKSGSSNAELCKLKAWLWWVSNKGEIRSLNAVIDMLGDSYEDMVS